MTSLIAFACLAPLNTVTQPMTYKKIDPLLEELSYKAFKFFMEQSHPKTGMTLDRANNTKDEPRTEYVSSCAATGFHLAAIAVGSERGWISKEDAKVRARKVLKSLEELPIRHKGWFIHWLDWETGKRLWNSEVSTIDTGILLAGMIMADSALNDKEIKERVSRIHGAIDWDYMRTDGGSKPDSMTFTMGWTEGRGFIEARWDICNELKVLLIPALGSDKVPAEMWKAWTREPIKQNGREFLMSGPLFLHQMAHGFYPFEGYRDPEGWDYWVAARNAVLDNRDYCIQNPKKFKGYSAEIWGLSAADGKEGYRAWGAPPKLYEDDGTIAPSSTVACMPYIPDIALKSTHAFKRDYPELLGRYGFAISFNPTKNWASPDVIGIDLGQMLLAVENYRDGLPHKLSMKHPLIKKAYQRIGFKKTKEGALDSRPLRVKAKR